MTDYQLQMHVRTSKEYTQAISNCHVSIIFINSASHMYSNIQTFLSRIHIYIFISISSYSYLYLVRNTLIAYNCVRTSWFVASNTREASLDVVGVRVFIRRSLCNLRLRGLFGRHHNRTGLQGLHQYLLKSSYLIS